MLKRILSLACCLFLTVGLFTYRPPEAKAIVTEASLATSVLWSFMQSAGITFNGTGMNSSSWAEAIEPYLRDFTEATDSAAQSFWHWLGYDGASEFIKALSWSKVTHPTTMPFPSVVIPPAVAKKMGEFTHWFAKKVGLTAGSKPVPVPSVGNLPSFSNLTWKIANFWNCSHSKYSDFSLDSNSFVARANTSDTSVETNTTFIRSNTFVFPVAGEYTFRLRGTEEHSFKSGVSSSPVLGFYSCLLRSETDGVNSSMITDSSATVGSFDKEITLFIPANSSFSFQFGLRGCPGIKYQKFSWDISAKRLGDSSIAVAQPGALSPTYDDKGEKPTVVAYPNINGDLASINDLLQQILDKLAANDLNSSASLEGEAAPDVPATDIGWKGTIEKIYQGIIDLPGRIAEAIKDLFIPHEGYAAEFVSGLTGAYQGRFGLLTYPFSVLGDFVGTVATLDEQEPILRWNDVKWQDHVVIAKGEYNLKSAIAGAEMQTVYQVYRTVASAALIVGFLHLCIRKLREVQSH